MYRPLPVSSEYLRMGGRLRLPAQIEAMGLTGTVTYPLQARGRPRIVGNGDVFRAKTCQWAFRLGVGA